MSLQSVFPWKRRCSLATAGLLLAAAVNSTCAVDFSEVARFNLDSTATDLENPDPHDIGTNPIAVAWNGSQLYVAGYNGTGDTTNNLDTAIVEVLGATATGLVDEPTFGTAFGAISTPTFRAYTGLDLSGDGATLAATHDNGDFGDNTLGIQAFNTADDSLRWSFDVRGFTGPSFDPGFLDEGGAGVATAKNSSGRRHLYDTNDGTELFGPSGGNSTPGMIWTSFSGGFLPRDMDFDPDTGDLYVRHNNRLTATTRIGGNELSDQALIVDPYNDPIATTGDNFLAQNLGFLSNTVNGDLLIYNDKDSNAADQPFADVVKVVDPTGLEQATNFTLLGGESMPDGGATYDFDFDPASQTLALLDFSNRNVHIFRVGEVVSVENADFDGDGLVAGDDFLTWQRSFEITDGTAVLADGDANDDGNVTAADLAVWESQFGTAGGEGAALAAVPEPSAIVLAFVAASTLHFTSRRAASAGRPSRQS